MLAQHSMSAELYSCRVAAQYMARRLAQTKKLICPTPINTYGLQKVMIEQALRYASRSSDLEYQVIRLSNPYGPGQNPHGTLGLITKLVYQALNHETINIFGDGSVVRDFIFIVNAIRSLVSQKW